MKSRYATTVLALTSLLAGGRATAGLLDSPPPALDGGPAKVVYRMGPVQYEPGLVNTTVTCTNLADGPVTVGLEIFDDTDVRAGGVTSAAVPAGASVTFATSDGVAVPAAVVAAGLPPIDHGKARVSARTAQLACTGLAHIATEDGAIKEAPLELVKKVAYGD